MTHGHLKDNFFHFFSFQACTFVFVLEMLVKMIAFSLRGYIQSRWNILDGFIVVISFVELIIIWCVPSVTRGLGFSVLRTFRLVRNSLTKISRYESHETVTIYLMWIFPKAIVLTTKPRFDVKRSNCVKARLGGENNRLRENPHKC